MASRVYIALAPLVGAAGESRSPAWAGSAQRVASSTRVNGRLVVGMAGS
jgi:hypothetical protein